jgi:hypothetical protein
VHLVVYIYKNIITMHGPMNVKSISVIVFNNSPIKNTVVNKHTFNQCEFHNDVYLDDSTADTLAVHLLLVVVLFCIQEVPNSSFGPQTSPSD